MGVSWFGVEDELECGSPNGVAGAYLLSSQVLECKGWAHEKAVHTS